jgi:hypothetical protein
MAGRGRTAVERCLVHCWGLLRTGGDRSIDVVVMYV